MTSSWMCVTQSGSNVVQLILPQSNDTQEAGYGGADNFTSFVPGQLFFIDSGPDIGSFIITKILDQDWVSNPPIIRIQLDQPLTHSTDSFPVLATSSTPPTQSDFNSNLPAYLQGTNTTYPISLNGLHLKVDVSSDGGSSWTTVEHLFAAANPYNDIATVLADIAADGTFSSVVSTMANGGALVLQNPTAGPRARIRMNSSPTSVSAHTILGLTLGSIGSGVRGAGTLPSSKRLYGSGLNQFLVDDWITIYAAKGGTVLSDGDDSAIVGTYLVTSVGSDSSAAPFWTGSESFIELDRTANFPSGSSISVRWIRHEEPDIAPSNTSNGGKTISDQFVRFRAYDSVSKKLDIINIPWATASVHPLLATSEQQVTLESPGVINTIDGERNYAHKAPFRVLRPDVLKISSTEMSNQRDGALYFVDLPVIGYGPGKEMNIKTSDGFVLNGNRKIDGYLLDVDDENFSYSTKENLHLVLPNSVLPVGTTAEIDNQFNLSGQNLQLTYDNAPLVDDLQTLFDAPLDRVTAASMLVRHFLPGYVLFDAVFSGGASEDVIAVEIIKYINNIDPDTAEIRTDLLQDIIKRKGAGTADLPLIVIVLFHGTNRRIRGMRSTKSIGIGDVPFFRGSFKQTYFIAGPDTSSDQTRPVGEQVFLKRT